jgi:hypothetical protein
VLKQEEKYKSPVLHLLTNYTHKTVEELTHFYSININTEFPNEKTDKWDLVESSLMSVDKTTQILVKSEQINLQRIDDYLRQIRRLTHYFTSVNDHLNLKTVLKIYD